MSNILNNLNNLKKYIDIQNNIDVPHPRIPRLPWHLPQQLLKKIKSTHLHTKSNGS
jgi:hypothetical protein